tara:strand:+ start:239 stop:421 length:183 start_codon:yes stop_codon:yes gene_type:complete
MSSLGFHSVSNQAIPTKVVQLTPVVVESSKGKKVIKSSTKATKPATGTRKKLVIKIRKPF